MKSVGNGGKKRQLTSLRASTLKEFFPPVKKKKATEVQGRDTERGSHANNTDKHPGQSAKSSTKNPQAEEWGRRLLQSPCYLTRDGNSWYILAKAWMPTPSREAFDKEWALHPANRHQLQVYGRPVLEKRWSQSWGFSYAYSGATNQARPLSESTVLPRLLETTNGLLTGSASNNRDDGTREEEEQQQQQQPYNGCLQNWYTPLDSIGLHADDEKSLCKEYPILSLSWGGTRRFLFRRKQPKAKGANLDSNQEIDVEELWLEDGDLLVMGGTCQETHKHEVPKLRKTQDPPTANRINWTIRAFR